MNAIVMCLLVPERRIRERHLRDKNKNRDQLLFEMLREYSTGSRGRGIGQFAQRRAERDRLSSQQTSLQEEEAAASRLRQFWGRVKKATSKESLSAKYHKTKAVFSKGSDKEDDAVELLASRSTGGGGAGGRGIRSTTSTREPPKDIFQNI